MTRRKTTVLAALGLALVVGVGAAALAAQSPAVPAAIAVASPTPQSTPSPMPTPSPTIRPTPSPMPTPSPTPPLEVESTLTGIVRPTALATRFPIAVLIDDNRIARPQSGFNGASIVYQAPADGGETRYMFVYQDGDSVDIGPVRSGRIYFAHWAVELHAAVGHYGGDRQTRRYLAAGHGKTLWSVDGLGRGTDATLATSITTGNIAARETTGAGRDVREAAVGGREPLGLALLTYERADDPDARDLLPEHAVDLVDAGLHQPEGRHHPPDDQPDADHQGRDGEEQPTTARGPARREDDPAHRRDRGGDEDRARHQHEHLHLLDVVGIRVMSDGAPNIPTSGPRTVT